VGLGPCRFREADVRRAIRAARAAGIEIGRIETDNDGRVSIIPKTTEPPAVNEPANPWDELLNP
jgi:hypothetical protein